MRTKQLKLFMVQERGYNLTRRSLPRLFWTKCCTGLSYTYGFFNWLYEYHFQFEVKVVEKTCVARGDENCTWEIYTVNHLPDESKERSKNHVSF